MLALKRDKCEFDCMVQCSPSFDCFKSKNQKDNDNLLCLSSAMPRYVMLIKIEIRSDNTR